MALPYLWRWAGLSLVRLETDSRLASGEEPCAVEETNVRFDRESWRKLYVAESMQHRKLSLFTRGVRDYLLRLAEEDGTLFAETTDPSGDLADALNAHSGERKLVERAVSDLLKIGYLSHEAGRLWVTKFEEAQAARSPGAMRQAKYAAKKKSTPGSGGGDGGQASSGDVSKASLGDVSTDAPTDVSLDVTKDETRRDETTTPKPPVVAAVACPSDLRLTDGQRGTLETGMIPGWAIDELTTRFVAKYGADPEDRRTLVVWRKCLSMAISSDWGNANKRPKKPEGNASVILWDTEAGRVAQ